MNKTDAIIILLLGTLLLGAGLSFYASNTIVAGRFTNQTNCYPGGKE